MPNFNMLFTLFGVLWVLPLLVKEVLLGWHRLFVGKKRRKVWKAAPLYLFWTIWKERNRIAFENEEFFIRRLKYSFVCNFWSWTKLCIDGLNSLINFFDWLGSRWRWVSFLYPSFFCFLPIGACCILSVCFGLAVGWCVLFNISFFCAFAYQKNRKLLRKDLHMVASII